MRYALRVTCFMSDLKYWIAINHFQKFGPARFKKLKNYFSNLKHAFEASIGELTQAGIEQNIAEEFTVERVKINPDEIIEKLNNENIKVVTSDDNFYPKLLSEIHKPPFLLYYKGNFEQKDEFSLAVVGTRKHTHYGKQATEHIVRDLTLNGLTIVSGLALGIDTIAHLTTVNAGGRTIAVLGSGIDNQSIYPSVNRYLADKIIDSGGAIISEFPPGTLPLKYNFPQRNRIISGLSLGTLVIEAGEKSGALITAFCSLEQNREVFALPGSIYSPGSYGPNKLIKQGANVIVNANDIIETLNLTQATVYIKNKKIIPESKEEEEIIALLSHEPIYIDSIIQSTRMPASTVNSALTVMEMKGMIKNLGGMQYVLAR